MTFRRILTEVLREVENQSRPQPQSFPRPRAFSLETEQEVRPRPAPPPIPPEETQRAPRPRPPVAAPPVRTGGEVRRSDVRAALASAANIRTALVLQEILGPPKSLRRPDEFS